MKRLLGILLSSCAISPATAWADPGWSIQRLILTGDERYIIRLNGVAMLNGGEFGIAVGVRQGVPGVALVATTNDAGRHWETREIDHDHGGLSKVAFINQTTAIAVGGGIYRSKDRGRTWARVSVQFAEGVSFEDAKNGTAVGFGGIIFRTTDGGLNWFSQSSPTSNHLYDVFAFEANSAVAVGDRGIILRTVDGGVTWTIQESGTLNALRAVSFADAKVGAAVGDGGIILWTIDGGNTWNPQVSGTTTSLFSLAFSDDRDTATVGGPGIILRTKDGGTTWRKQQLPEAVWDSAWYGIYLKGETGIAVGGFVDGVILRTVTAGEPVTCTIPKPQPNGAYGGL